MGKLNFSDSKNKNQLVVQKAGGPKASLARTLKVQGSKRLITLRAVYIAAICPSRNPKTTGI